MPEPSYSQFQPILFRGAPLFDPPGDESPASVDIVGDSQYPAAFFAYDGATVYFRLRLNADPRFKTGFLNFSWGVLFDTDDIPGTYEWLLSVDGLNTSLELVQNTVQLVNSWNDPAEGTNGRGAPNFSLPIVNYNIARAHLTGDGSNFGGNPDYFLDFFISANTLFNFLGINENTIIRLLFFTSANPVNYNKDSLQNQGFQFASAFGDPAPVEEGDLRAKLAIGKAVTAGPLTALTGENLQYSGTITVTNTGKSQANTVYVSDLFGFDLNTAVSIVNVSSGIANYNPASKTISWNVGNLDVGQSQTLSFQAIGQFVTLGQRSMDTATATGVDNFTGQQIAPASDTFTVSVTSTGGIAGNVLDAASGIPVSGAQIVLTDSSGNVVASGSTDAIGGYGLVDIPPGNYTLTVNQANYQPTSLSVTTQPDQTTIANVLLTPLLAQISGQVTDASGAPISGAIVRLKSSFGAILQEVPTDGNGNYAINGVLPGSYTLLAEASGFQHAFVGIQLSPDQSLVQNFVLQSNPSGVVGTVTGNGQPLQGVFVEVLDNANQQVATTTTDASGHYSIIGFSPGSYRLHFSEPGFAEQLVGLEVGLGETKTVNVNLQLNFGSFSGQVTDSQTGLPLAHSIVRVVNSAGITFTSSISDTNGFYSVGSLPPGTYSVTFSAEGYADQTIGATVVSGQDTPVNAALDKLAGAIAGVVTNELGQPLAQTTIRVFFNELVVAVATTTTEGSYEITGLSPGNYTVRAEASGYSREVLGATVVTFETTRADFVLTRNPGTLLGTVQDSAGNSLPGSIITVRENTAVSPVIARGITDESGNYIFSTLAPGSYIVSAESTGFQIGQTSVTIVSGEQTRADFQLQPVPSAISGQITDASTGIAIISANIEIRIVNANGTLIKTTYSDAQGHYTASDLPPGTYTVIASAENFQTNSASVSLAAGETATVNLALLPGPGAITGVVLDAVSQAGIAGATVKVTDANGVITGTAITDSQGNFTVTGLAPGDYTISAIADGFQSNLVGAIVQSGLTINTILNLQRNPGSIIGSVTPAPNGTLVQLYDTNNLFLASRVADASGSFRFENISEGSYIVIATAPGYITAQTGVTVFSNQESSATLTLQPQPATVTGTITDPSGGLIVNAIVRFLDQNQTLLGLAATDAAGNYEIGNLPAGNLIVIAAASGFSETIGGVSLQPGETFIGLNFTLIPNPGTIAGHISDAANGLPIAGSTVTVRLQDAQGLLISTVTASVFGNYSVSNLAPGTYTVTASAEGYAIQSIGATVVSDAATEVSFQLTALFGSISGTIFGPQGEALTGGTLPLKLFDNTGVLLETKLSNPDGTYSFTNLSPGIYLVGVSSPGLVSKTITANVSARQTTIVDFTLETLPGTLDGRITNADTGVGIGGAVVTLNDLSDSFVAQGYTDQDGFYSITGLPAGTLKASVLAARFSSATASVIIAADQTVKQNFALLPNPGSVKGCVNDFTNGADIIGASIEIFDANNTKVTTVLTNIYGIYTISGLSPGSYTARATANSYDSQLIGFSVQSGSTATACFTLSPNPASLQGTIVDAANGKPLEGAIVEIRIANTFGVPLLTTKSGADGVYVVNGLVPNNYTITVRLPGYASNVDAIVLGAGQAETVNFSMLANPAAVGGAVTDAVTGAPLANALVTLSDSRSIIIAQIQTNQAGRFLFEGIRSGDYSITVILAGKQSISTFFFLAPGERLDLSLVMRGNPAGQGGNVATVPIQGPTNPVPGAVVQILNENHALVDTSVANYDGIFLFPTLAPGSYTVSVIDPRFGSQSAAILLRAGKTGKPLIFILNSAPGALAGTVRDERGKPLFFVIVQVLTQKKILERLVITNRSGRYGVADLSPGTYLVRFLLEGKQPLVRKAVIHSGQTTILNVTLFDEQEE